MLTPRDFSDGKLGPADRKRGQSARLSWSLGNARLPAYDARKSALSSLPPMFRFQSGEEQHSLFEKKKEEMAGGERIQAIHGPPRRAKTAWENESVEGSLFP